jgi:RNA polymerase sigma factor (TIGR02999 family)
MPVVYGELRRLARHYVRRERPDHTLQATALVHEAYMRLVDQRGVTWQNRAHFFGVAAQLMRRILVDYARRHRAAKRGGSFVQVSLNDALALPEEQGEDVLALDDALERLAAIDPRQARVVELRLFSGLTVEEAAEVLDVSAATVKREWTMAKAWLSREIQSESRAVGEG